MNKFNLVKSKAAEEHGSIFVNKDAEASDS